MSRRQTTSQIKQLKEELKAANRTTDARLLKLVLIMVILAAVAAFIYGRIAL
jgi:uncharacterized membrane protein